MIDDDRSRNTETSLSKFFGASNLSIRIIEQTIHLQTIHLLGLVYAHFPQTEQKVKELPDLVTNMLILRTLRSDLYRRLMNKEATDEDVVNGFFEDARLQHLRMSSAGYLFETMVILIWWGLNGPGYSRHVRPLPDTNLTKKYNACFEHGQESDPHHTQASKIRDLIGIYNNLDPQYVSKTFKRIELISSDLIPIQTD